MPAVSSELQETILSRQRDGATITQIAQDLGLSRTTVYKALDVVNDWESYLKDKSSNINRLALNAVEKACKRGDARIGLAWLEHTVLAATHEQVHIHGDVSLVQAVGMVPSTTSNTINTSSSDSTVRTEAPAKPTQLSIGVSSHTNFSQFSLAELEAEVARRKAQLIEVQPEP